MNINKWFETLRCLLPVLFAACLLVHLPFTALAATTYDFASLGATSGGFRPQGNRFLVSDSFTNDTSHSSMMYITSGLPSASGIIIKPDGVNLMSFTLNDMSFLIDPGPENITSLKISAMRNMDDPVSVTVFPGLIEYGSTFTLSGLGADLSAFTNVTQLQIDVSMNKVMNLDFASVTISTEVHSPPAISNVFEAASIPLNGTIPLTFTIDNQNSTATLSGIAFSNYLPAGLVVAPVPDLSNNCGGTATAVAGSSLVSLSGATLAASTSCSVSVNVQGTTAGVKNNSVTIASANGGTGNTSNASLEVEAADLVLVNATSITAIPLNNLTFNVSLTNSGPSTAHNVSIIDTLPANTTFKSISMGGGSGWGISAPAVGGNGTLTFSKSSVATGETAIFQVTVQVGSGAANGSTISNTAVVSSLTVDPDPANNASSATSTVSYPVRVELPVSTYFQTLSAACTSALSPNTIKARGIVFAEKLTFDQKKNLTLKGGYDSEFGSNGSTTTVASPLIVANGTLTLERIVVK